ncbi:MAG: amidohydrolase family protein [Mariniblastus sp.]
MNIRLAFIVAAAIAIGTSPSMAQPPQSDVYFAKQIWTGVGEPINDAAMVVIDGKIVSVGPKSNASIPPTANRHELGSRVIIPGLIAAQTNLSGAADEERTLTPQISALDGFDFFADRNELLKSGITTAQISTGQSRLMSGVGGVVQLSGKNIGERILSERESLRIILTSSSRNPPRIFEPAVGPVSNDRPLEATRPQLATLTASLAGLRQIFKQATARSKSDSAEEPDAVIDTVAELLSSKTPIRISAQTTPEIRGAVSLAEEFDLDIVLVDCVGLKPFEKSFKDWKPFVKGVVLSGFSPGTIANPTIEQIKNQKEPWEFARELIDAGIPVSIRTRTDSDLTKMMFVAGQFMQDDLTAQELLASITSNPAALMGVDSEVGSLEKGKRADFVVLNDAPFKLHSRVVSTYVSGNATFESKKEATTTVVKADRVYIGDGKYLDNASVVVKGKTVRGIGSSVSAPTGADVKTFDGAVIVPGYVDLGAGLGIGGRLSGAVTLSTKLGGQLYGDDPAIEYARSHGITTALLGTSSTPSPLVAFKLGSDARVISDPIAIRFKLTGDTAAGISTNEKLLKAGKAYADSWIKYEKDLAEYEAKVKAEAAKPEAKKAVPKKEEAKPAEKKAETKKEDSKKPEDKKETDKKEVEKKDPEKKDPEKKEKKKVLTDPITGTWEGELESERLPEPLRTVKFELVLEGDTVTGTADIFRASIDIESGSYNRETRELKMTISRRGTALPINGTLDESGKFKSSIEMGRMGAVDLTATRTVDKSKKPEPEKKDKPEDKKEDKKDKPADKDDKKEADSKDSKKPEEKSADEKKAAEKAAAEKAAADKAAAAKKAAPKAPKKPRLTAALEPYRALFAGKIPAFVESRDLNSIKATAELFSKKYKVRTTIVGADDLAREPGLLAGYDVSVVTGPSFTVTIDKNPPTNLPQLLANERLQFGFQSSGTTGAGQLPGAIQFAVSQGLSSTDAIEALTASPAKMLSDKINFGSLASGKDADLVVLSGPPFEFSTKVLAVMIDGVWVYEREEQK